MASCYAGDFHFDRDFDCIVKSVLTVVSEAITVVVSSSPSSERKPVRTHVITGFLGTGKTTLIMYLLKQKPAHEKWAVLVNEFGEVGVDGAILAAQTGNDAGVAIREVPGGCLCCTAGLPFQIGLNWLIAREKPDVLLIEPTGLGHPAQLLETLRGDSYQTVLTVGSTVTLVDPRHLSSPRYRQHEIYSDQLAVADVLVANKSDLASETDQAAFETLVAELDQQRLQAGYSSLVSVPIRRGELDLAFLHTSGSETHSTQNQSPSASNVLPMILDLTAPLQRQPDQDYRRAEKQADGMLTCGWLIRPEWRFDLAAVRCWFAGLDVERAKAVLNTDAGRRIFNLREGMMTELDGGTDQADDSRLELIMMLPDAGNGVEHDIEPQIERLEADWKACVISD